MFKWSLSKIKTTIPNTEEKVKTDPWKHRSTRMFCKTCMFFVEKKSTLKPNNDKKIKRIGRCRRHAPTMNGYPVVFETDWCGDHKLDENKSVYKTTLKG